MTWRRDSRIDAMLNRIARATIGDGRDDEIDSSRLRHEQLNPVELARVYDHASRLIEELSEGAHLARVDLEERMFSELERVE